MSEASGIGFRTTSYLSYWTLSKLSGTLDANAINLLSSWATSLSLAEETP
jgi:hypothetical protein